MRDQNAAAKKGHTMKPLARALRVASLEAEIGKLEDQKY